MKVVFIHYHLLKGGVTTVLRRQVQALLKSGDQVLVLAGEADEPSFEGAPPVLLDALRYDGRREPGQQVEDLAGDILKAIRARFPDGVDIVHIHNPLIRKNSLFLPALALLQREGLRLFLQNHDFAEDWRPDVWVGDGPYPGNCHYAVINGRDREYLVKAGLKPKAVHLLPNPVLAPPLGEARERNLFLYPVRAIRRKNIGEILLLSLFLSGGCRIGVTLPPTSEKDVPMYRFWRETAARLSLPVAFDLGLDADFGALVASSRAIITTSVKEGFGFSFLEPWLASRPVLGRRIDYVCRDFEGEGMVFNELYDGIDIPLEYFDSGELEARFTAALDQVWELFGRSTPPQARRSLLESLFSRGVIDFGRLDEELQAMILGRLSKDDAMRRDLSALNPFLAALPDWQENEALTAQNRATVVRSWSPEATLHILKNAWQESIDSPCHQHPDREALLHAFLDPAKLSLAGTGYD